MKGVWCVGDELTFFLVKDVVEQLLRKVYEAAVVQVYEYDESNCEKIIKDSKLKIQYVCTIDERNTYAAQIANLVQCPLICI